jgi:MFS family permease
VKHLSAERAVVTTVALGALLAPLNSTMIAVALPRIIDDLGTSVRAAGWLVTSYLIALALVQPLAGRLGDAVGRRPPIVGGLVGFGLASTGAAFAPTFPALVVFRVLQAIFGAVVFPNGAALLRVALPAARRGRGFGAVGSVLSGAAAVGPLIGGALIAIGGWRAIFWANLPIVGAALVLAWRFVPAERSAVEAHPQLFGIALWRRPRFAAASAGVAFSNLAFYSLLISAPVLLARRHDWSSSEIAAALAALSAPTALLAPLGGRLSDRLGRRAPAVVGNGLVAAAGVPLVLDPVGSPAVLVACLVLAGTGVGLSTAALQTAAIESVPAPLAGAAAGMYSTSRYLGSIVGTIALGSLITAHGHRGYGAVFAMVLIAATISAAAATRLPAGAPRHEEHALVEV